MNFCWILSLMWLATTNRTIRTFFSYKVIHLESLENWHALESWLHWFQDTENALFEVWLLFSDSQSTHWITCVALSERNSFSTWKIFLNFYDFWEKKTRSVIPYTHLQWFRCNIFCNSEKWRLTKNSVRSLSWPRSKNKIDQSQTGSDTVLVTPSRPGSHL